MGWSLGPGLLTALALLRGSKSEARLRARVSSRNSFLVLSSLGRASLRFSVFLNFENSSAGVNSEAGSQGPESNSLTKSCYVYVSVSPYEYLPAGQGDRPTEGMPKF